ncbi:MAG: cell division protein SepF [Culicoidibacterales bacterium]
MGLTDKIKNMFIDDEDDMEEEYYEEQEHQHAQQVQATTTAQVNEKALHAPSATSESLLAAMQGKGAQMILSEPKAYSESQEIADHLLNQRGVIVNLQRLSPDQGKRIIDFLSGTVYAIKGDIQKVGHNIFLCTPNSFGIAGTISDEDAKRAY